MLVLAGGGVLVVRPAGFAKARTAAGRASQPRNAGSAEHVRADAAHGRDPGGHAEHSAFRRRAGPKYHAGAKLLQPPLDSVGRVLAHRHGPGSAAALVGPAQCGAEEGLGRSSCSGLGGGRHGPGRRGAASGGVAGGRDGRPGRGGPGRRGGRRSGRPQCRRLAADLGSPVGPAAGLCRLRHALGADRPGRGRDRLLVGHA